MQGNYGVGRDAFALWGSEPPPGLPVEVEELMENE